MGLTVIALDATTRQPVPAVIASVAAPDPNGLIDDPNALDLAANQPVAVTVMQVTSHEVPIGHRPLYLSPFVRVHAAGFEDQTIQLA